MDLDFDFDDFPRGKEATGSYEGGSVTSPFIGGDETSGGCGCGVDGGYKGGDYIGGGPGSDISYALKQSASMLEMLRGVVAAAVVILVLLALFTLLEGGSLASWVLPAVLGTVTGTFVLDLAIGYK